MSTDAKAVALISMVGTTLVSITCNLIAVLGMVDSCQLGGGFMRDAPLCEATGDIYFYIFAMVLVLVLGASIFMLLTNRLSQSGKNLVVISYLSGVLPLSIFGGFLLWAYLAD
jgi:hypothetical protein